MQPYLLDIPGLAERIAATRVTASHAGLLGFLRAACPALNSTQLATTRSNSWLEKRQVRSATGELIHHDHRVFLQAELARSGDPQEVIRQLRPLDYRLSECALTELYFVSDPATGSPAHFTQVRVLAASESVDRRFFSSQDEGSWRDMANLRDLCEAAERGEPVPDDKRRPTLSYRLKSVIDVDAFIRVGAQLDLERREADAGEVLQVTELEHGPGGEAPRTRSRTVAELDPDLMRYDWRGQRFIDDWATSSTGRSGARLSAHWVLQTSDYTDSETGERTVALVPVWTFPRKLAEVTRAKNDQELYAKLTAIDKRVGVPFVWYFWMLHGNRVHAWVVERVLEAAEADLIVLPEHDYQVLRRWNARPYGF